MFVPVAAPPMPTPRSKKLTLAMPPTRRSQRIDSPSQSPLSSRSPIKKFESSTDPDEKPDITASEEQDIWNSVREEQYEGF